MSAENVDSSGSLGGVSRWNLRAHRYELIDDLYITIRQKHRLVADVVAG